MAAFPYRSNGMRIHLNYFLYRVFQGYGLGLRSVLRGARRLVQAETVTQ